MVLGSCSMGMLILPAPEHTNACIHSCNVPLQSMQVGCFST